LHQFDGKQFFRALLPNLFALVPKAQPEQLAVFEKFFLGAKLLQ